MKYIKKKLKSVIRRFDRSIKKLPEFKEGTKVPLSYRIRRFFMPNLHFPSHIISANGAYHNLSNDPIDDSVLEEMLGKGAFLFFPKLSEEIENELMYGGWVLDIGAFNGSWGIEMLMQYPEAKSIFLEPSPDKCRNIRKAIHKNKFSSKTRLISSGIGVKNGKAWLVMSEYGSWGDWLEYEKPKPPVKSLEVSTVRLQNVLNGIVPVIIKCNAEGGEFELVKQLITLRLKPKLIILMIHVEMGDMEKLKSDLLDYGYNIEVIKDHPRRPVWHASLEQN